MLGRPPTRRGIIIVSLRLTQMGKRGWPMKCRFSSILFLCILSPVGFATVAAAQGVERDLPTTAEGQRRERSARMVLLDGRSNRGSNSTYYNKKMTEAQKKLLAPSPEDQAAYRDFLRQPHTGLVRLLPRGEY